MNKYARALALFLLNRRIKKIENKAFTKIRKEHKMRRKMRPMEYVEDPKKYRELLVLRANIEQINGPWGGALAGLPWTRRPKHEKYIKPFPPFVETKVEPPVLSEEEQRWADMSLDNFYEELDGENND